MSLDGSQSHFDYNDRYGIRPQRAWLPYALALVIVGGVWIIWAGVHHAEPAISANLLAFNNEDPRNIEIRYTITRRDPSREAICTITARDMDKVIVGQISDLISASSGTVERVATIPSRADAVNAGVVSCRLK
jgi:hypothetical protein